MCIVSAEAKLSSTRILSMPVGKGRHVLAYSNKAKNMSGKTNAMILPVPGKLKQKWFKDTTKYNKFLEDIERDAYINMYRSKGIKERGMKKSASRGFEQFSVGMYDVMITDDIDNIYGVEYDALKPEKRPEISEELLNFFRTQYAGWSFVICMFDGAKEMESQPVMFEYKPFDYNTIYFPTMDCHTGGAPDLKADVKMDHTLMFDYPGLEGKWVPKVKFKQEIPEKLKRRSFISTKWKNKMKNGDMYMNVSNLEKVSSDVENLDKLLKRATSHPGQVIYSPNWT